MRKYTKILLFVATLMLFSPIFAYVGTYLILKTSTSKNKEIVIIEIPPKTSISGAFQILRKEKIIDESKILFLAFKTYCYIKNMIYKNHPLTVIYGEYELKPNTNLMNLLRNMQFGNIKSYKVTFPEGITTNEVIRIISNIENIVKLPIDNNVLSEGKLMPDTYLHTKFSTNIDIINDMKSEMTDFIDIEWDKRDKDINQVIKDKNDAIILASIIEKETAIPSEKQVIASVYINRLKKKMALQACPSVLYGINIDKIKRGESAKEKLYLKDLKYKSSYNTYIKTGLPPTPICNPGRSSIIAVLHPVQTDYLYFVAKDGKHIFSKTFDEHKKSRIKSRMKQ